VETIVGDHYTLLHLPALDRVAKFVRDVGDADLALASLGG